MSILQIPVSRKSEYLIYLGLSSVLVATFAQLGLGPWWDENNLGGIGFLLFTTIVSPIVAGILFACRLDRVVDIRFERLLHKEEQYSRVRTFVAHVLIFLKFWEVSPSPIGDLSEFTDQAIESAVRGEDLHEDIWTQKGFFFLILSVIAAGPLIPLNGTIYSPILNIVIRLVLYIAAPSTAIAVAWYLRYFRGDSFTKRIEHVLEFRFYQDWLLTERLLRKSKTIQKSEAGTPAILVGKRKPVDWHTKELDPYKEALAEQCEEIDKVLRRREWKRFDTQFRPVCLVLSETAGEFLAEAAFDFAVKSYCEVIAPPSDKNEREVAIRFESLKSVLSPLLEQYQDMTTLLGNEVTDQSMKTLLGVIKPSLLNPHLYQDLGRAISKSFSESLDDECATIIAGWISDNLDDTRAALGIIEFVNKTLADRVFRHPAFQQNSHCAELILNVVENLDYDEAMHSLVPMALLPMAPETRRRAISYLLSVIAIGYSKARLMALDALGVLGVDILDDERVTSAFRGLLASSGKEESIAAISILTMIIDRLVDWKGLMELRESHEMWQRPGHGIVSGYTDYILDLDPTKTRKSILNLHKLLLAAFRSLPREHPHMQDLILGLARRLSLLDAGLRDFFMAIVNSHVQKEPSAKGCADLVADAISDDKVLPYPALIALYEKVNCLSTGDCAKLLDHIKKKDIDSNVIMYIILVVSKWTTLVTRTDWDLERTKDTFTHLGPEMSLFVAIALCELLSLQGIEQLAISVKKPFLVPMCIYYQNETVSQQATQISSSGSEQRTFPDEEVIRSLTRTIASNDELVRETGMLAVKSFGRTLPSFPLLVDYLEKYLSESDLYQRSYVLHTADAIRHPYINAQLKEMNLDFEYYWLRRLYSNVVGATR